MKPKIRIERKAWAILACGEGSKPYLMEAYKQGLLKFKTRREARAWCAKKMMPILKYGWDCQYRPVRIREVVEVI
jgi:hypothetical protein